MTRASVPELRGYAKHYWGDLDVKDADFVLRQGEDAAAMGDDGTGKPTFKRCRSGVDADHHGRTHCALGGQRGTRVKTNVGELRPRRIPVILILHTLQLVFGLLDRFIVFRRSQVSGELKAREMDGRAAICVIAGGRGA